MTTPTPPRPAPSSSATRTTRTSGARRTASRCHRRATAICSKRLEPRLFAEGGLFADVVKGGPLDLSRRDSAEILDRDPALVAIASRPAESDEIFGLHPVDAVPGTPGELRVNPLYVAEPDGDLVRLRLQFPSEDYAEEFGACRQYLPDEAVVSAAALAALADGRVPPELAELARRRVILDLPRRYY